MGQITNVLMSTTPTILHTASNSVNRGLLKLRVVICSNQSAEFFKLSWNGSNLKKCDVYQRHLTLSSTTPAILHTASNSVKRGLLKAGAIIC